MTVSNLSEKQLAEANHSIAHALDAYQYPPVLQVMHVKSHSKALSDPMARV